MSPNDQTSCGPRHVITNKTPYEVRGELQVLVGQLNSASLWEAARLQLYSASQQRGRQRSGCSNPGQRRQRPPSAGGSRGQACGSRCGALPLPLPLPVGPWAAGPPGEPCLQGKRCAVVRPQGALPGPWRVPGPWGWAPQTRMAQRAGGVRRTRGVGAPWAAAGCPEGRLWSSSSAVDLCTMIAKGRQT